MIKIDTWSDNCLQKNVINSLKSFNCLKQLEMWINY